MSTELQVFDKLKSNISTLVSPTQNLIVSDQATNIMAQGVLKTLTEFEKQIEQTRVLLKKPHLSAIKKIDTYAGEISEPLTMAKNEVKAKMLAWANAEAERRSLEQRKIREEREAQERAARAVREAEEAEQRKAQEQEAMALKAKQEADRKAFEEEQKKKAEALKAFGVDEESTRQKAEAAMAARMAKEFEEQEEAKRKAKTEQAEAQMRFEREEQERIEAARQKEREIEASRPKNTRKVKMWAVEDHSLIPDEYWILHEPSIGLEVRAGKTIPGIRVWEENTVVAR